MIRDSGSDLKMGKMLAHTCMCRNEYSHSMIRQTNT